MQIHRCRISRRKIYNIWCGTPCQKRCSARSSELKMSHIIHYASFKLTAECFAAWTVFNVCTAGNKGGEGLGGHQQVARVSFKLFICWLWWNIFILNGSFLCLKRTQNYHEIKFLSFVASFLLAQQNLMCNSSPLLWRRRYNTQILNVFLSQLFKLKKKNKCEVISKLTPLTGFRQKTLSLQLLLREEKSLEAILCITCDDKFLLRLFGLAQELFITSH